MTPYIDARNISKAFGARLLFSNISLSIAEGQRVGLVARNGAGKTTLLSMLAGKESCDTGSIVMRRDLKIGILEQSPVYVPEDSVLDACFNHRGDPERIVKAKQVLTRLKIPDFNQPMAQLSGGQRKRVALANVLITEPDLLILDEPTNHLDLGMIVWLEDFLVRAHRTLFMVTHDRYFLDRVCNTIIELDNGKLYVYRGNYRYFIEKRQERIDAARAEVARANNLYRRELEWMRRMPQARGHKARYREEAFVELEKKAKQRIEERQVRLKSKNTYIGSKICECQYISKTWSKECIILKDFYYNFRRFEKMGIVGDNGSGKTTFIKLMLGREKPDSGKFDIGDTVRFGYFSQEGMEFDTNERVIDTITAIADYVDYGGGHHITASQLLQHFLFTPEQQYDYVYKLSGGERRKLYLCTILMRNPNFLVLDEPTNDLDIQTLQVLEEFLQDFPGCVIVVSHDRYFMDKIVDHLLVFKGNGIVKDFPGNYTQYREWLACLPAEEKNINNGDAKKEKPMRQSRIAVVDKPRRKTFKEKCEEEQLERDITALEAEQSQIESELCLGTLSVEQLTAKSRRLYILKNELDEKSMRWLELSELE